MIIGTFNLQNQYFIKHYDGKNIQDNPAILNKLLSFYHIDILGTQEIVLPYLNNLRKELDTHYQIVGGFRFPKFFLKKYNETNSIITHEKILSVQTKALPFLPSFLPRIMTVAYLEDKNGKTYCVINTHLAFKSSYAQKRQLQYLLRFIRSIHVPVILMGDFNMTIYNPLMKNFIQQLEVCHLKRLPVFEKTFAKHTKQRAIDHIFLSDNWEVKHINVIHDDSLEAFSDHYLVLADVNPTWTSSK